MGHTGAMSSLDCDRCIVVQSKAANLVPNIQFCMATAHAHALNMLWYERNYEFGLLSIGYRISAYGGIILKSFWQIGSNLHFFFSGAKFGATLPRHADVLASKVSIEGNCTFMQCPEQLPDRLSWNGSPRNKSMTKTVTPVKVCVIGDPQVGKTSLITAAATESFPESPPPVLPATRLGEDCTPEGIPLIIVDTSSRLEDKPALELACLSADVIILVFDAGEFLCKLTMQSFFDTDKRSVAERWWRDITYACFVCSLVRM